MLNARGVPTDDVDNRIWGRSRDLLHDPTFEEILKRAGAGYYCGGWLAPPCSARSRLRSLPGGPGPLADLDNLHGLPFLSARQIREITDSDELIFRTLAIRQALHASNSWSVLEAPLWLGGSPSIYLLDEVSQSNREVNSTMVVCDQGFWGAPSAKPTHLEGTLPNISMLGAVVLDRAGLARLNGKDSDGTFRSQNSSQYPEGLNQRVSDLVVADCIARAGPSPPHPTGDPPLLTRTRSRAGLPGPLFASRLSSSPHGRIPNLCI